MGGISTGDTTQTVLLRRNGVTIMSVASSAAKVRKSIEADAVDAVLHGGAGRLEVQAARSVGKVRTSTSGSRIDIAAPKMASGWYSGCASV